MDKGVLPHGGRFTLKESPGLRQAARDMVQSFGSSVESRALVFEPMAGCETLGSVSADLTS